MVERTFCVIKCRKDWKDSIGTLRPPPNIRPEFSEEYIRVINNGPQSPWQEILVTSML
jgi:hypothetical protein